LHQSKQWKFQVFGQYTGEQFTEATNSTYTSSALHGLIPAFAICDLSIGRQIKKNWTFGIKVNNVTNNNYFTRRALAYPGPGILPADGINARVTLIYQSN
jgi:Fe(3+) dicitrate transport protein